jgi:hypothetical protein
VNSFEYTAMLSQIQLVSIVITGHSVIAPALWRMMGNADGGGWGSNYIVGNIICLVINDFTNQYLCQADILCSDKGSYLISAACRLRRGSLTLSLSYH